MENEMILGKSLDLISLKDEYLNYIDVANTSIKTYNEGIKMFASYMKDNNISQPTRQDIINFRDYYKDTHSVATANAYLIAFDIPFVLYL